MVEHLTDAVDKLHNYWYILFCALFNQHLVNVNSIMHSYISGEQRVNVRPYLQCHVLFKHYTDI